MEAGKWVKKMAADLKPDKTPKSHGMSNGQIQRAIGSNKIGVKAGDKQSMTVMMRAAEAELNSQNPKTKK